MRSFYFFGYDSKLLRLGINEQVMSFLGHVSTCWSFCSLARAVTTSAEAVCSFRWSCFSFCRSCCSFYWSCCNLCKSCCSFRCSCYWYFRLSLLSWKNYMFSSYIILVSNRLVVWYLMKFLRCNCGLFVFNQIFESKENVLC